MVCYKILGLLDHDNSFNLKIYTYIHSIRVVQDCNGHDQQYIEKREHEPIFFSEWGARKILILHGG